MFSRCGRRLALASSMTAIVSCASALVAGLPATASAQSGPEILSIVRQRHADRVAGVDNYTVVQEVKGTRATVHYEKRTVDGASVFVPVSAFTVVQEWLDSQRLSFVEAAARAGLQALAPELSRATYGRFGRFLGTLEEAAVERLGSGDPANPLQSVRDVLVRGATRAGLQTVADGVGAAGHEQLAAMAGGLTGLGDESILGQLGRIALGQAKNVAVESLATALGGPVGAIVAGLARGDMRGTFGAAAAGGPPGAAAPSAAATLANAGMAALIGGTRTMVAQAMTPDLGELDRAFAAVSGPDVYEVIRLIGADVKVSGTETVDGHSTWTLEVIDPSTLRLPRDEEFAPKRVALQLDQRAYLLRGWIISGEIVDNGEVVSVSVETRLADYREVGSLLYPFRSVTLVRGVDETLSADEREQMAQLPGALDERIRQVREQLQKMPPEQRAMAERALAQQVPQLEQMMQQARATAGGEPIAIEVQEVVVNRGRPESLAVLGGALR